MKRWFISTLFVALAVSLCGAQASSPGAAPAAMQSSASAGHQQGVFTVELAKSLDSKKLKEGDVVEARIPSQIRTPDGATIPRGSKVVGHVTEAKARSKGDPESQLGIVFDKIVRSGGEDTAMKGVIQAVAPNPNADTQTGGGIGYGDLKAATAAPPAPSSSPRSVPMLTDDSKGVLGIKNLELGPDGVLTSSGKEVKLDSGTRVLLNVTM